MQVELESRRVEEATISGPTSRHAEHKKKIRQYSAQPRLIWNALADKIYTRELALNIIFGRIKCNHIKCCKLESGWRAMARTRALSDTVC